MGDGVDNVGQELLFLNASVGRVFGTTDGH